MNQRKSHSGNLENTQKQIIMKVTQDATKVSGTLRKIYSFKCLYQSLSNLCGDSLNIFWVGNESSSDVGRYKIKNLFVGSLIKGNLYLRRFLISPFLMQSTLRKSF